MATFVLLPIPIQEVLKVCGRIVLSSPPAVIASRFFLDLAPELEPRFNISPGQEIAAVIPNPRNQGSILRMFRWGLELPWEKGPDNGPKLINARSETVADKASFGQAFAKRRCLIPVDGFYEWNKRPNGSQPFFFSRKDNRPFALGGLFERHEYPGGHVVESCTILTTAANKLMRPIHHRMPLVLPEADWKFWLTIDPEKARDLNEIMKPDSSDLLQAWPVSREVNSAAFDGPECLKKVWDDKGGQLNLFG
jgi:putative SOS response-associated peptidase YedK